MKRRRVALAAAGLVGSIVAALLLVRGLSADVAEIQVRSRFIDGNRPVAKLANDFEIPQDSLLAAIGCPATAAIQPDETLVNVARDCGTSLDEAKRRIAHAAFARPENGR